MPLKPFTITILFFLICYSGNSQVKAHLKDSDFFKKLPVYFLQVPPVKTAKDTLPFAAVEIIDARFDTTFIGFKFPNFPGRYKRMCFENNSVASAMASYITGNYILKPGSNSTWNLAVVLEKCWTTFTFPKDSTSINAYCTAIIIKADILAERDGIFHPIYQIDSAYTASSLDAKTFEELFTKGTDRMLKKVVNKQVEMLKISSRALYRKDIQKFRDTRFEIPILQASAPTKGVYRTFEDFKNNRPVLPGFELFAKRHYTAIRGFDKDNTPINIDSYWGFSDGEYLYKILSGSVFPLIKEGNTYTLRGFKSVTWLNGFDVLIFSSPFFIIPIPTGGTDHDVKVPLQVDMDTGELN